MSRNSIDPSELRRVIREELSRFAEPFIFVLVLVIGVASTAFAKLVTDSYWQSFLLNIGSNLLVFVVLFWIFQYFLGRQPGDTRDKDIVKYKDRFVDGEVTAVESRSLQTGKPARLRSKNDIDE